MFNITSGSKGVGFDGKAALPDDADWTFHDDNGTKQALPQSGALRTAGNADNAGGGKDSRKEFVEQRNWNIGDGTHAMSASFSDIKPSPNGMMTIMQLNSMNGTAPAVQIVVDETGELVLHVREPKDNADRNTPDKPANKIPLGVNVQDLPGGELDIQMGVDENGALGLMINGEDALQNQNVSLSGWQGQTGQFRAGTYGAGGGGATLNDLDTYHE